MRGTAADALASASQSRQRERVQLSPNDPEAELGAALARLIPTGVQCGVRRLTDGEPLLFPSELETVAAARPARIREYAAGRALLRELCGHNTAIPTGPDGAPRMPAGWICSLAHDNEFVIAVVTDDPAVAALGLDLEPIAALDQADVSIIVRPDESLEPLLGLTIKEAVYKAWRASQTRMLEHHDVRVTARGKHSFDAVVLPEGQRFAGSFGFAAGRWLSAVVAHRRV